MSLLAVLIKHNAYGGTVRYLSLTQQTFDFGRMKTLRSSWGLFRRCQQCEIYLNSFTIQEQVSKKKKEMQYTEQNIR